MQKKKKILSTPQEQKTNVYIYIIHITIFTARIYETGMSLSVKKVNFQKYSTTEIIADKLVANTVLQMLLTFLFCWVFLTRPTCRWLFLPEAPATSHWLQDFLGILWFVRLLKPPPTSSYGFSIRFSGRLFELWLRVIVGTTLGFVGAVCAVEVA